MRNAVKVKSMKLFKSHFFEIRNIPQDSAVCEVISCKSSLIYCNISSALIGSDNRLEECFSGCMFSQLHLCILGILFWIWREYHQNPMLESRIHMEEQYAIKDWQFQNERAFISWHTWFPILYTKLPARSTGNYCTKVWMARGSIHAQDDYPVVCLAHTDLNHTK